MRTDDPRRFEKFAIALGQTALRVNVANLSREKLEVYWLDLHKYPHNDFLKACETLGTEPGRVHFPSVGEFIAILDHSGSGFLEANQTWHMLLEDVSAWGRNRPPKFGPVTSAALAAVGGWSSLCDMPPRSREFEKNTFVKAFIEARDRAQRGELIDYTRQIGRNEARELMAKLTPPDRGADA
jgi:hypothetical protein